MFKLDYINCSHRDVAALFMRIVLFYMLFVTSLSGCNGYKIKPPVNSLSAIDFSLHNSQFAIVYEEDEIWGVDKSSSVIDVDSIELSIKKAKNQPGYISNPGGLEGLIGVIIGTQIVREASTESIIRSMTGFRLDETDENKNLDGLLKDIFNVYQDDIYSIEDDYLSIMNETHNKDYYVFVQPRFYFSENYNLLRVNLIVEVRNKDSETVFRNLYIYSGKPINGDKNQCIEYWVNNELYQFRQMARQSVTDLMHLIHADLGRDNSSVIPDQHTSVRYNDSDGDHYIRGEIIDKKSNRLVFRTLRGYLKSIYVDKYL